MLNLAILGSTGSIGRSALSVVDLYPESFRVVALASGSRVTELQEQARRYSPSTVALFDSVAAARLKPLLSGVRVLGGVEGVTEAATLEDVDVVVSAISGAAGLLPTYHAVREGKRVALANKETLVMAGDLIMEMVREGRSELLPVDSEHSALHQCLRGTQPSEVRRLLLTASGGPFFRSSVEDLRAVTVEQALNHPTWDMGPKITVDSATMMNKGLEVIEAHHLFGVGAGQISIVVHPQSIVHSMVEFVDGNLLAQMSITDMRSAILYALTYPDRWESNLPKLDLLKVARLEFYAPDPQRFPCVRLAYEALGEGGTCPVVLNAANEVAVESFLQRKLPFTSIPAVIEEVLAHHQSVPAENLEVVLSADREARLEAKRILDRLA